MRYLVDKYEMFCLENCFTTRCHRNHRKGYKRLAVAGLKFCVGSHVET